MATEKKISSYRMQPVNKLAAQKRADELKTYLKKKTGVTFNTRVWHNLGWQISLSYGTISIYVQYYTASQPQFNIMNGAKECGSGHIELTIFTGGIDKLIDNIKKTLIDHKELIDRYIDGFYENKKLNDKLIHGK